MKPHKQLVLAGSCALLSACASLPQPAPLKLDCISPIARPIDSPRPRYTWGTERGDAWVARNDGDSRAPTWRTVISGPGEESVAALAIAVDGDVLVAGSTTSRTLPGVAGQNANGREGFVLRLDSESGRVRFGSLVGTAGDEVLTGVVETRDGRVLVAGLGSPATRKLGRRLQDLIQVAPVSVPKSPSGTPEPRPTFVSSLGPRLEGETSRTVLGPLPVANPRLWLDCRGEPVVGLPTFSTASNCSGNWPNLVYEQDRIGADYLSDHDWSNPIVGYPPGGWGFHALRWKEHHRNPSTPSWALDWSLATVAVPKSSLPQCSDTTALNQLEFQIFKHGADLEDPSGAWQCGAHSNVAQLALFSAFLMNRWGTPVYTHLGAWSNLGGPWVWSTYPVGLERVTFEPHCQGDPTAYNGQKIEDLCNFGSVDRVEDLNCNVNPLVPGIQGSGFALKLDSFMGAQWGLPLVWWNRPSSWDPDTTYSWQQWYTAGEYVYDPPAGSEREVALLAEAARQLAGQVLRGERVRAIRYVNGRAYGSTDIDALVAADQ